MTKHVAVTGISGFLGGALARRLTDKQLIVHGIVRTPERPTPFGASQFVVSDLTDVGALRAAFAGCDGVFHLAGLAHQREDGTSDSLRRYREAIVSPTAAVLQAAVDVGVSSVIIVSSVAAVCSTSDVPISDFTSPAPTSAYGRAKLEADGIAEAVAGTHRVPVTVLRPPAVFGPGMRGNPLRLFDLVSRGVPLPVGAVRNARSMIYVENFVTACVESFANRLTGTYLVTDSPARSTAEWARLIGTALQSPARVVSIPPSLITLGARVARLTGSPRIYSFVATQLERLLGSVEVEDDRFRRAISLPPEVLVDRALAQTASWFRHTHRAARAG